jgi:hypothetical protein
VISAKPRDQNASHMDLNAIGIEMDELDRGVPMCIRSGYLFKSGCNPESRNKAAVSRAASIQPGHISGYASLRSTVNLYIAKRHHNFTGESHTPAGVSYPCSLPATDTDYDVELWPTSIVGARLLPIRGPAVHIKTCYRSPGTSRLVLDGPDR